MPSLEERFAESDDALAEAYEAHGALVFSFCRRQLGAEGGRDVTQEVFVAAWRARHRFDPSRASLRTWLMGIARNKVIDAHRHAGRRPRSADGTEVEPVAVEPAAVDQMADRMVLADALSQLPERARAVVELSFFEQLSHQEIADKVGMPLGTVKSDIRRSLDKLRRELETTDG